MKDKRITEKISREMVKFEDFLHKISHSPDSYVAFLENPYQELINANIYIEDYLPPDIPPDPGGIAGELAAIIEEIISQGCGLDAIITENTSSFSRVETETNTNFDHSVDCTTHYNQMTECEAGRVSNTETRSSIKLDTRFSGIHLIPEVYKKITQGPLISIEAFELIYSNVEKRLTHLKGCNTKKL